MDTKETTGVAVAIVLLNLAWSNSLTSLFSIAFIFNFTSCILILYLRKKLGITSYERSLISKTIYITILGPIALFCYSIYNLEESAIIFLGLFLGRLIAMKLLITPTTKKND